MTHRQLPVCCCHYPPGASSRLIFVDSSSASGCANSLMRPSGPMMNDEVLDLAHRMTLDTAHLVSALWYHQRLWSAESITPATCPTIHGRRSINWSGPTVLMFCRTAFPRVCPRHAGEETKKCKHPVSAFLGRRHHLIPLSSSLPQMLSLCPVLVLDFSWLLFFRLSLPFLYITISFSVLPVVYVNHIGGEVRLTRSALRYCVVPSYDRSDFVTWGSLRRWSWYILIIQFHSAIQSTRAWSTEYSLRSSAIAGSEVPLRIAHFTPLPYNSIIRGTHFSRPHKPLLQFQFLLRKSLST